MLMSVIITVNYGLSIINEFYFPMTFVPPD